jgi:hypothetical protein
MDIYTSVKSRDFNCKQFQREILGTLWIGAKGYLIQQELYFTPKESNFCTGKEQGMYYNGFN